MFCFIFMYIFAYKLNFYAMKYTAVEWLENEFKEIFAEFGGLDSLWLKRFNQAKEMEKEQIIEARINGDLNGACIFKIAREKAEQYYKETFKSE